MTPVKKFYSNQLSILITYILGIFLFYYATPWYKDGTIYFFRSDEGVYLYIYQKIAETGNIPTTIKYIGEFQNYIYPTLYLLISNINLFFSRALDLQIGSLSLQGILFISLIISVLMVYKIAQLVFNNPLTSYFSGLAFILLPIISNRLFYLHATFYANFVGISFFLVFIYYLLKYNKDSDVRNLIIAVFFYSLTLFTHQLVFMMATIFLGIHFLVSLFKRDKIIKGIFTKFLFVLIAIAINVGYILRTPIVEKIFSILGIAHYEQFGKEMVTKSSASNLPPLIPTIILAISFVTAIVIIKNKKYHAVLPIALFYIYLISSILLNYVGIHLPASFRYDTFLIVPLPFLLGFFIVQIIKNNLIKIAIIGLIVWEFIMGIANISNSFYIEELKSAEYGLTSLNCQSTVSYFRIAPWVPVVSRSNIYYAHVDIYNAHQKRLGNTTVMLFDDSVQKRLALAKDEKVDCLLYTKNMLIKDNIRVKGWEKWRYEQLYSFASDTYEDENVVIFKL